MAVVDVCILGAGVAGLSLLLLLHQRKVPLESISIVDPFFDGGDLVRRWTKVQSNTPWSKSVYTLRKFCPDLVFPDVSGSLDESSTLADLGLYVLRAATPLLSKVHRSQGLAKSVQYSNGVWKVEVGGASPIHARKVFFTTGADPKTLDLGLPTVPLDCALDPKRLSAYIRPSDSVLVVGTMHSGCLVIDNLLQLGARTTALYNTASPFYFDRDGDYDGLKREAAEIADKIQQGLYKDSLQLVSTQDLSTVVRAAKRADWAIYCMGFAPRSGISIQVDGTSIPTVSYDGDTGAIHGCPSAWGFGVGFPNRAPDGVHWDVSVAAFVIHMANQLSTIFTTKE